MVDELFSVDAVHRLLPPAEIVEQARQLGFPTVTLEVSGRAEMRGRVDRAYDEFVAGGRALATLILAVVIFALLPVLPFTEQYARETVPQQYWQSPVFRSVNRRISAAWGAVIAGHAVSTALAGVLTEPATTLPSRPVDLLFNWVIPVLLTWWAWRYTARVSAQAHDAAVARTAHQTATRA